MRAKRSKSYKRAMALYTTAFKFRTPYQVLVDGEFIKRMSQQKLDPTERLADILGGDTKIMVTQCVVSRLYEEGAASQAATDLAKTFERRRCNHWQVKATDGECITGIIGKDNRYRYCVATQAPSTRGQLRRVPGVPILFEARGMILLEPPSDASVGQRKHLEESKLHVSKEELAMLKPKASTSRLPPQGASTSAAPADAQEGEESAAAGPASGMDAVAGLPSATRATAAVKPNTIEQKLDRVYASKKRKAFKEPNPLSVKKKKRPNMTAPKKTSTASKPKGEKSDKKENPARTAPAATSKDPTAGVTRTQGDGTSKKALKRKAKKAAAQGGASQTAAESAASAPAQKAD
ncbi:hypothetical protein P389DRAFT_207241 [Cystobasidium minutum MCA 4210]|uniref:uncharacterized protein n=1 Tax=Cystobasidium minutum MCA 4210 TaxID=1397322 RepID=UPI0034CFEA57|eukprot:jgi/Rhomi1/207241/estExt_Genemark1.C_1_t10117